MAFPDFPVVLLLMGLPGSGKTTLGRWLGHHLSTTHTEVHHVEYDAILHDLLEEGSTAEFSPQAWKASRELAQEQVQQLAEAMSSRDTSGMIIVDDNMFYRSMRKQIFLIAKRSRCAYMQLFVDTQLDDALTSNERRPVEDRVHAGVIERMHNALQRPDAARFPWEASTATIAGPVGPQASPLAVWPDMKSSIAAFWQNRLSPNSDPPDTTASVAMQPSSSPYHQLDLATRQIMQQACSTVPRPSADEIKQLNTTRRSILSASRLLPREQLEVCWLHFAADFSRLAEQSASPQRLHRQPRSTADQRL